MYLKFISFYNSGLKAGFPHFLRQFCGDLSPRHSRFSRNSARIFRLGGFDSGSSGSDSTNTSLEIN
ncbi:hypothetical protein LEP1GSC052_1915 [Leptospira kmetyi serovar Malaysia str. Bejo-Iso9]|nr:hypothetical protein LEP1GSC052_1915 [Leptospira kmetyi serovar Malaysia str. Bejo-Iso9]